MHNSYEVSAEDLGGFRRDGAVVLRGLLDAEALASAKACFDWSVGPGKNKRGGNAFGSKSYYNQDSTMGQKGHDKVLERYLPLVKSGPFASVCSQLWGCKDVFYFDSEIFKKEYGHLDKGGQPGRTTTPFHQDTTAIGIYGEQFAGFWISFEDVPAANCLQIVRGSHRGPKYDQAGTCACNEYAPLQFISRSNVLLCLDLRISLWQR